ncbi:Type I restriction enzyme EcoKI M protein [Pseudovibrio axinellae]|uniref:site-specific DNA-methyltransferase (adenine-specific) n=1 Tax=Pseudovibrio axinellae TaxID=989403 RepID=A0A166AJU7_9HYPH|nr:type I restriction-modification system subunit M [Pseudovibrio axinellae]KZL21210.1 Type I restriction enzyme EcoKI M protein [Pseudovibrio axinellae]SEQ92078.1 type I restriction enzyme M protein [Pseudovibrio axinellae]
MAIKKTELYSSLWASCDELRGGMDASQYKNYILTLLFMKYVTDKYGNVDFGTLVIPEGGSFADMIALKGKADIGDKMNQVVAKIANENNMAWLSSPDNDFNNEEKLGKGKAMVDTLTKLVSIFEDLNFGKNRADGDDLLGDAYEYLMRHFATESGKSKGQFYTPAEVSRILAKVLGINANTVQDETAYDPTCGSGSLLLKVNEEAPNGLSLYGQEKEQATAALAKMNMVLHNSASADIWQGDTVAEPNWKSPKGELRTFDYAVANPPFSLKSWSNGINLTNDEFERFEYGEPPEKNGDYAFLLHIIKSLKSTGKGAVILPHGVLFRGNAEAAIRRNIIRQGYIKGIIGLPANLFYGTGIPACIIVIDKEKSGHQNSIFMIDASKGFVKDGNKNRLREQDIHRIVDVFNRQQEVDGYSRLVPFKEIAEKNEYNLNIPRYIDSSAAEDIHDLSAHLSGGIPNRDIDALQDYWDVFPTLRTSLFEPSEREGYSNSLIEAREVKATILGHEEFKAFKQSSLARFEAWKQNHKDRLADIEIGDKPKEIIFTIAEDLLAQFGGTDLLSKYDIYQILMSYWDEVMQDDVHLIVQEDWKVANTVRLLVPGKDKNGKDKYKEEHDFEFGAAKSKKRYKSDIIPPALVIAKFFTDEQAELDDLQANLDAASQELETFIEENGGEDGLLEEAKNEKGGIVEKAAKDRKKQSDDAEEIAALDKWLKLNNALKAAKKEHKEAKDALDKIVFDNIQALSIEEIKQITIFDKWFGTVEAQITEEIERVTQQLATRVKTLEERYQNTLPSLTQDVATFSARVEEHLKKMGLAW